MSRLKPFKEDESGLEFTYNLARSSINSMARDSVLTK